jgi:hypothetical protein
VESLDAGAADAGTDAGVQPPDTCAGQQLSWVLAEMNGALATTDDATLESHFSADFLAAVPTAQVRSVFDQLALTAPWRLLGFEGAPRSTALVAEVTDQTGAWWRLSVTCNGADVMSGLLLSSGADLDPSLDTWPEVEAAFSARAPTAAFVDAALDGGACAPVHAVAADTTGGIGSAFKLYVLSTLANEVDAGVHSWSEPLAIRDEWKSLPSGTWQNLAVGTTHSLLEYAQQMVSVSDNTATDHLLFTVGRAQVEQQLSVAGHHAPSLNQPFLSTRELFTLKLMLSQSEQQAWASADLSGRRALLGDWASRDPRTSHAAWTSPRLIEEFEWFASPLDLCRVMATLRAQGQQPGTTEVLDVLAINPGIADPSHAFSYVGYKGGSEPGVLSLTWLLRRNDGGWRVVSAVVNDPQRNLDEARVLYVVSAARALAGR